MPADGEGRQRDEIEQAAAARDEEERHSEGDNHRPPEGLVALDPSKFAGERDKVGRNSERIDDYEWRYQALRPNCRRLSCKR